MLAVGVYLYSQIYLSDTNDKQEYNITTTDVDDLFLKLDRKTGFERPIKKLFSTSKFLTTWNLIGPGFRNLGNTCFLNSVLQCMLYTAPLNQYLQTKKHSLSCRIKGFCALCAMEKLVSECYLNNRKKVFSPVNFVRNLQSFAPDMRSGAQQDAHEFLKLLIGAMQNSVIAGFPSLNNEYKDDLNLLNRIYETSVIHQIFGGYTQTTVTCQACTHASRKFDPMLELPLDVAKCSSVSEALKLFKDPEILDDDNKYACGHCNKKTKAEKSVSVYKFPLILTLQLKIFDFTNEVVKLTKKIKFDEVLEFPKDKDLDLPAFQYKLFGVIVHQGTSATAGHYYSYIKNSTGTWYKMNDSAVTKVTLAEVLNEEAYILFYQRESTYMKTTAAA